MNSFTLICNIKKIKKIFLFFILSVIIFIGVGVVSVSFYEKQVISSFTEAANNHLKTKIDVEIEGLSLFEKFPFVSITMKNIKIYGSLENHKEKLAELDRAHFTISLFNLIRNNYKINAIYLEEGFVNLYVNKKGDNNYTFIESEKEVEDKGGLKFDFRNIILTNVQLNYINQKNNQNIKIYAFDIKGALSVNNAITDVKLNANCDIEHIQVDGNNFIKNKKLRINGNIVLNNDKHEVKVSSTEVLLSNSKFIANGLFKLSEDKFEIGINGENTDFKTLISLLPNSISKGLEKYDSKGKASFDVKIKKDIKNQSTPFIQVNFGCQNVELIETNTNKKLDNLSFTGEFTNGLKHNENTSKLTLKDLNGMFDGNKFTGELSYENFNNPLIKSYLKGEFPVSFFMQFSDSNHLKNISGDVKIDVKLNALQKDLQSNNQEAISSSGEVELKNVSFENNDGFYHFKRLSGLFIFNKNDIAISDFSGMINNTDFKANGYLKGFFTHFFSKKDKLLIITEIESDHVDFDKLIESSHNNENINQEIDNKYLKNIHFSINAKAKKVKWGRFHFKNVKGDVRHDNLVFKSNNLMGEIGNGSFKLSGILNSKVKNNITLKTNVNLKGIEIDSIFYYFNDFNEDFITHKNLKGNVFADAVASMCFDKYLNLKPKTLIADIDFKALDGELNNFEPMQNLSKFIEQDELKNIKFSELSNVIHIENEKIDIPDMHIKSSVSTIRIKGWHTFDQKIFYKVKIPLKSLNQSKQNEAENALEKTLKGMTVHLIISGTTDDFKIEYDKQAVKRIIVEKVIDKIKDIRNLIKGYDMNEDNEQIELEEEDFFEFEEEE